MKKYNNDKIFLANHLNIHELSNGDKRVLVTPDLQGRVLTSSASGENGFSFGWLNYDLIQSGTILPHCNNYGGEDRFWLGPEGGQFSIFFPKGSGREFQFDDWQAPSLIDTDKWELVLAEATKAVFTKSTVLENWSGTKFTVKLDRTVTLIDDATVENELGLKLGKSIKCVGFSSENVLTNAGSFEWTKATGMLSVWILGQFIPSEKNTVIIPYKVSKSEEINDRYFGKIETTRLKQTDTHLFFKGDGGKRGKIGVPPSMTIPVAGAYDPENETLTVVKFNFEEANDTYVNSMWKYQDDPFCGDVINSYNDGPLEDGSIMGPFYEIETSSPAARLKPSEKIVHTHKTMHFTGNLEDLNAVAKAALGIDIHALNI